MLRPLIPLFAPLCMLALTACQPQAPVAPSPAPVAAQTGPAFTVDACRQLGTFAIAIAEGRRDGITRDEALGTAEAGPLTGLFRTIVRGVYDAPRPSDPAGWDALRRAVAEATTGGCVEASTGRTVEVRTRD